MHPIDKGVGTGGTFAHCSLDSQLMGYKAECNNI